MLSFLRDQEVQPIEPQNANQPVQSTVQGQDQEYFTVTTDKNKTRKSTIALAVLFGIGVLCLWFMIKKSSPQTATAASPGAEETEIEMAITRLTGVKSEMFRGIEKIVNKFYEFSKVQQIEVNELLKNPFKIELFLGNLKNASNTGLKDSDINAEQIRQQRLKQQTKDMQLVSIMQSGQGNCCMIDDTILSEGDSIRGFTVLKIGDSSVKLGSQSLEIVLNLPD